MSTADVKYRMFKESCRACGIPELKRREWERNGMPSFQQYKADGDARIRRRKDKYSAKRRLFNNLYGGMRREHKREQTS